MAQARLPHFQAAGRHDQDADLPLDDFRHLGGQLLAWPGTSTEPVEVVDAAGFTNDWVRATGLQLPSLVRGYTAYQTFLRPLLQDMRDLVLLSKELGEDREVQTLDVAQQAPGPRWTMRQWCLYWKERQPLPADASHPLPGGAGGPRTAGSDAAVRASAAAAAAGMSSADDGAATEMEDEADSAFVHQGDVDQFRDTSAPRKGIREANKRRLLALTCAALSDHPAAATPVSPLRVPPPLAATDLVAHLGLAREVAAAAAGGGRGGAAAAVAAAVGGHHLAVWPAGAATNFRLLPGGAASWWAVTHGRMVFLLVPPTEQALALYASWVASGARDRGLPLLGAWPHHPASAPAPGGGPHTGPVLPSFPSSGSNHGPGPPPSAGTASSPRKPPPPVWPGEPHATAVGTAAPHTDHDAAPTAAGPSLGAAGAAAPNPNPAPSAHPASTHSTLGRVVRLEVAAGELAILPAGWPLAVTAAADSVAVCGALLRCHALGAALRSWELEELLGVKQRARFPLFKHLMWHAAVTYGRSLRSAAGLPMLKRQRATTSRDRVGGIATLGPPATMTTSHNAAVGQRRPGVPQPQDSVNNGPALSGHGTAAAAITAAAALGPQGKRGTDTAAAATTGVGPVAAFGGGNAASGRKRGSWEKHGESPRRQPAAAAAALPPRANGGAGVGVRGASPPSPQPWGGGGKRLKLASGAAMRMFNKIADEDEDDWETATSPRDKLRSTRGPGAAAAGQGLGRMGRRGAEEQVPASRPQRRAARGRNWSQLLAEGEEDEVQGLAADEDHAEGEGEADAGSGGAAGASAGMGGSPPLRRRQRKPSRREEAPVEDSLPPPPAQGPGRGRGRRRGAESDDEDYQLSEEELVGSDDMSLGSPDVARTPRGRGGGVGALSDGSEGSTPAVPVRPRAGAGTRGRGGRRPGGGGARTAAAGLPSPGGWAAFRAAHFPPQPTGAGVVGSRQPSGPAAAVPQQQRQWTRQVDGTSGHVEDQPQEEQLGARRRRLCTAGQILRDGLGLSDDGAEGGLDGAGTRSGGEGAGGGRRRKSRVYDDTDDDMFADDAMSGGSHGGGAGRTGSAAGLEDSLGSGQHPLPGRRRGGQGGQGAAAAVADGNAGPAAGPDASDGSGAGGDRPAGATPGQRRRMRRAVLNDPEDEGQAEGLPQDGVKAAHEVVVQPPQVLPVPDLAAGHPKVRIKLPLHGRAGGAAAGGAPGTADAPAPAVEVHRPTPPPGEAAGAREAAAELGQGQSTPRVGAQGGGAVAAAAGAAVGAGAVHIKLKLKLHHTAQPAAAAGPGSAAAGLGSVAAQHPQPPVAVVGPRVSADAASRGELRSGRADLGAAHAAGAAEAEGRIPQVDGAADEEDDYDDVGGGGSGQQQPPSHPGSAASALLLRQLMPPHAHASGSAMSMQVDPPGAATAAAPFIRSPAGMAQLRALPHERQQLRLGLTGLHTASAAGPVGIGFRDGGGGSGTSGPSPAQLLVRSVAHAVGTTHMAAASTTASPPAPHTHMHGHLSILQGLPASAGGGAAGMVQPQNYAQLHTPSSHPLQHMPIHTFQQQLALRALQQQQEHARVVTTSAPEPPVTLAPAAAFGHVGQHQPLQQPQQSPHEPDQEQQHMPSQLPPPASGPPGSRGDEGMHGSRAQRRADPGAQPLQQAEPQLAAQPHAAGEGKGPPADASPAAADAAPAQGAEPGPSTAAGGTAAHAPFAVADGAAQPSASQPACGTGRGSSAVGRPPAMPAKRGSDAAAKPVVPRPAPQRPHGVKSLSEAVPDAQKALGLVALGGNRAATPQAAPKGSLTRMMPGRPGQGQRQPASGLLAAAAKQQRAAGAAPGGAPGLGPAGARLEGGSLADAAGDPTSRVVSPRPSPLPPQQPQQKEYAGAGGLASPVGIAARTSDGGGEGGLVREPPPESTTPVGAAGLARPPGAAHTDTSVSPLQLALRAAGPHTQRSNMPPPTTASFTTAPSPTPSHPVLPASLPGPQPPASQSTTLAPAQPAPSPSPAGAPAPTTTAVPATTATSTAAPAKPRPPLSRLLSPWEVRDLPQLVAALRRGLADSPFHDDVPFTIRDPEHVLEQLEEALGALEHPSYAPVAQQQQLQQQAVQAQPGGRTPSLAANGWVAQPAAPLPAADDGPAPRWPNAGGLPDMELVGSVHPPAGGTAAGGAAGGSAMGPPPPATVQRGAQGPGAARTPPPTAAASQHAAAQPPPPFRPGPRPPAAQSLVVRFATDAEVPAAWRQLRDHLDAQRGHSPGPGSTAPGTTLGGDTVEQTAETDPANASIGHGLAAGGASGMHPPRSAARGGAARPISKKLAKLKKGLGL